MCNSHWNFKPLLWPWNWTQQSNLFTRVYNDLPWTKVDCKRISWLLVTVYPHTEFGCKHISCTENIYTQSSFEPFLWPFTKYSKNACLTKATNIIMVPTRIRFLITPLLSAWHCGPNIGFDVGPGSWCTQYFLSKMKGVQLCLSIFYIYIYIFPPPHPPVRFILFKVFQI